MRTNLTFMTTTTDQAILANGIIPLTTIQRKYGCATIPTSDGILLTRPGYYKINASVTFTAPVAGVASIQLQKNGADVIGITASTTVTTATTEVRTLNINGIVKVDCSGSLTTLNIINTGVAITLDNAAFEVEYLD